MSQFWYVFTCAPNKERQAASRLGERGHLANVPLLPFAKRKRSRHNKRQLLAAIPGYVLVQDGETMPAKTLRAIMALEFANGDRVVHRRIPGKVSQAEMQEFIQFLSVLKEASSVKQSVKAGDKVRIHYGPFEGKVGEVESVKGAKVNLLIELFKIAVKTDAVELVTATEKQDATGSNSLHKSANHGTTFRRDGGRFATGGKSKHRPAVLRA